MLSPHVRDLIDRLMASDEPELAAIGEAIEDCAETDAEAAEVARQFVVAGSKIVKEITDAHA